MIITDGRHTFEVVDHFPLGYQIWNIAHTIEGHLPLCRLKQNQPFEGCYEIEPDTLKALKCDGAQEILDAIRGGQDTVEKMEKYINRHKKAKPNTYEFRQVERIKKALTYMKQLKY